MLEIADNSGVKTAQCIKVLGKCSSHKGKYTRPTATVGDIICVAIKKHLPNCQLDRKKVYRELREKNFMKIVSLASEVV